MAIGRSAKLARIAEQIHEAIGDDILFDDRRESISAKFKDADLIGVPYRIILSHRTADRGEVELISRDYPQPRRVPIEGIERALADLDTESNGSRRSLKRPTLPIFLTSTKLMARSERVARFGQVRKSRDQIVAGLNSRSGSLAEGCSGRL